MLNKFAVHIFSQKYNHHKVTLMLTHQELKDYQEAWACREFYASDYRMYDIIFSKLEEELVLEFSLPLNRDCWNTEMPSLQAKRDWELTVVSTQRARVSWLDKFKNLFKEQLVMVNFVVQVTDNQVENQLRKVSGINKLPKQRHLYLVN